MCKSVFICVYMRVSRVLTDEFIYSRLVWLLEYSFHSERHLRITRQSVCPLKPIINDCSTWHSTVHGNSIAIVPSVSFMLANRSFDSFLLLDELCVQRMHMCVIFLQFLFLFPFRHVTWQVGNEIYSHHTWKRGNAPQCCCNWVIVLDH